MRLIMARFKAMNTDHIPAEVRMIVPFSGWIARHPRIVNIMLVMAGVALLWIVLNYRFTTYG